MDVEVRKIYRKDWIPKTVKSKRWKNEKEKISRKEEIY